MITYADRYYQTEAVESLINYFYSKDGNPVVAMPTGTGKSIVIARFCYEAFRRFGRQRILMLTHVKELVKQNSEKLTQIWPDAPIGIYSAGLKQRDVAMPITFGGVASVNNCADLMTYWDLVIIDECHLLSPNNTTMYQQIINRLKEINPYLKVIGLSATPYRMGTGLITDNGIFTDICYDITGIEPFNRLIKEGYLSLLIPKRTRFTLDVSGVGMNNGDFAQGQLQRAINKEEITYNALKEACELGANRRSWLVFAAGVEHSESCADMLNSFGVHSVAVHSKTGEKRDSYIKAYKNEEIRCLVGNNIFTTGFDHPMLDLIIDLQPTMSVPKHVQKYGRGTRPSPATGKENCLVLDFAGNTKRLGPINDPLIPDPRKKKGEKGTAPVKICEICDVYNYASARFCVNCGAEFPVQTNIEETADTRELIKTAEDLPQLETFNVTRVTYNLDKKEGSPDKMRVNYYCGLHRFNELVCFEHKGYPRIKACDWWRRVYQGWLQPPETTEQALQETIHFKTPKRIRVWINKKYPEVMGYED